MSEKKSKTAKQLAKEREVEEMLKNWDIVSCYYCGKRISIMHCNREYDEFGSDIFVCKECSNE